MNFEFDEVDAAAIGAVGPAGARTFMLQAWSGGNFMCLKLEKEHVVALGAGAREILSNIGFPEEGGVTSAFEENAQPSWNVGTMGLAYEEARDRIFILCQELVEEGAEQSMARLGLTRQQLTGLGHQGLTVAAQGRQPCPVCGLPMDPAGHLCPGRNGHGTTEI